MIHYFLLLSFVYITHSHLESVMYTKYVIIPKFMSVHFLDVTINSDKYSRICW